jgi:hypothetical protein
MPLFNDIHFFLVGFPRFAVLFPVLEGIFFLSEEFPPFFDVFLVFFVGISLFRAVLFFLEGIVPVLEEFLPLTEDFLLVARDCNDIEIYE